MDFVQTLFYNHPRSGSDSPLRPSVSTGFRRPVGEVPVWFRHTRRSGLFHGLDRIGLESCCVLAVRHCAPGGTNCDREELPPMQRPTDRRPISWAGRLIVILLATAILGGLAFGWTRLHARKSPRDLYAITGVRRADLQPGAHGGRPDRERQADHHRVRAREPRRRRPRPEALRRRGVGPPQAHPRRDPGEAGRRPRGARLHRLRRVGPPPADHGRAGAGRQAPGRARPRDRQARGRGIPRRHHEGDDRGLPAPGRRWRGPTSSVLAIASTGRTR